MIYEYEIEGTPIAWTSHRGFGKKSFNPHFKEKQAAVWSLKKQQMEKYQPEPISNRAIRIDFFFEVPAPKSMPKALRKRLESGERIWCIKRPDRTNFLKFAEDCLFPHIIADDNLVVSGKADKYYTLGMPKTIIKISLMGELAGFF